MMKSTLNSQMQYGTAIIISALLCLPSIFPIVTYPSKTDSWCYDIVIALTILASCIIIGTRRIPRLHILDWIVLFWMVYITYNFWFISQYPALERFHESATLFIAYIALRFSIPYCIKEYSKTWIIGLCLTGIYQIYIGLSQIAGLEVSRHHLYPLTGTFFNPGPYAILIAAIIAIAITWLYKNSEEWKQKTLYKKVLHIMTCTILAVGLPVLSATWSRTAWLVLIITMIGLLGKKHHCIVYYGLICAICFGAGTYFLKQESANGRLLMNIISGNAWLSKWITGHGIGSFPHAYGKAQIAFFTERSDSALLTVAGSPEYAFNELIGLGIEQGTIGMACALTIVIWSIIILIQKNDLTVYGYIIILASSLLSYPFTLWSFRICIVGWLSFAVSLQRPKHSHSIWKIILGLAISTLSLIPLSKWTTNATKRTNVYQEYQNIYNIQDTLFINELRESHKILKDRPDFLFTYGKALHKIGRYNDSNEILREGTYVSCDPMFYIIMGNNYVKLGAFHEAEANYHKAFSLLPNRIYPLYRLMLLYQLIGESDKAQQAAEQINMFPVKINSPAIRKIKEEAKDLLQNKQVQK